MDAMIVNVTTEASRFAGRAVVAVLLLVGFWLAGLMVQRLMARLERAEHARQDIVALLGQVAKGTLVVLGVVTALGTVGVNVTALVAGLGSPGSRSASRSATCSRTCLPASCSWSTGPSPATTSSA